MGGTDEWVDWYTSDENKDDRDMLQDFPIENPKANYLKKTLIKFI